MPLPAAPAVFPQRSCRRLPLGGYANFSGSSCLSCSCDGALSVGFAVSLVRRLVFHLVPCSSSRACDFGQLPLLQVALRGLCLFCHHIPGLLLRWWLRLGCNPSLVFSVLLLHRLACWGSLGSAPCVRVLPWGLCLLFGWQCDGAFWLPSLSGFVTCSVISSCGSQPVWVLCSVHCLVSLTLGWVCFWPAVSTAPVRCGVCSLGCPSWLVLLLRSLLVLHLLLLWGGLVTVLWPLLLLLCCGVSVAPFCCLGLLRTLPCRVLACGFLWFRGPSSWCFLGLFTGVLSSRFQRLRMTRGGCCLHFVRGPLPMAGAVFFSLRWSWWLSLRLALRICTGFLFSWPGVRVGFTVSSSYVFLRDGVTLWVNSVFLSLLIANEGLHCWLFLSVLANPFWGCVVVFLRPPWVCRHFLWLVAALLPGFSLSYA